MSLLHPLWMTTTRLEDTWLLSKIFMLHLKAVVWLPKQTVSDNNSETQIFLGLNSKANTGKQQFHQVTDGEPVYISKACQRLTPTWALGSVVPGIISYVCILKIWNQQKQKECHPGYILLVYFYGVCVYIDYCFLATCDILSSHLLVCTPAVCLNGNKSWDLLCITFYFCPWLCILCELMSNKLN